MPDRLATEATELDPGSGEDRHFAVLQHQDVPGEGKDGGDVRCQDVLAIPDANDQRRSAYARSHETIRKFPVHHGHGAGPVDLCKRGGDCVFEAAIDLLLDQVGQDLGVGIGGQAMAGRDESRTECAMILDDAVVDDRQAPGAVGVGVGVSV